MKKVLLALVVTLLYTVSAQAIMQLTPPGTTVIGDYYINKNGTGPGNGNGNDTTSNLYRLNTYFLPNLPDIVPTDHTKLEGGTGYDWSSGGLANWDYAVIHYGAGAFGGSGGSIDA